MAFSLRNLLPWRREPQPPTTVAEPKPQPAHDDTRRRLALCVPCTPDRCSLLVSCVGNGDDLPDSSAFLRTNPGSRYILQVNEAETERLRQFRCKVLRRKHNNGDGQHHPDGYWVCLDPNKVFRTRRCWDALTRITVEELIKSGFLAHF